MDINFKPLEAEDMARLEPYFQLRSNLTCDSVILESFLWKEYYQAEFAVVDEKAVLVKSFLHGAHQGALPICRKEDMAYYFHLEEQYFNEVLGQDFNVLMGDEPGIEALNLAAGTYDITELTDMADYVYDAESLRTLAGKKYHKKKNNVNAFLKEYNKTKGYSMIISNTGFDNLLYADSIYNITKEIVDGLNARYSSPAKK